MIDVEVDELCTSTVVSTPSISATIGFCRSEPSENARPALTSVQYIIKLLESLSNAPLQIIPAVLPAMRRNAELRNSSEQMNM